MPGKRDRAEPDANGMVVVSCRVHVSVREALLRMGEEAKLPMAHFQNQALEEFLIRNRRIKSSPPYTNTRVGPRPRKPKAPTA